MPKRVFRNHRAANEDPKRDGRFSRLDIVKLRLQCAGRSYRPNPINNSKRGGRRRKTVADVGKLTIDLELENWSG